MLQENERFIFYHSHVHTTLCILYITIVEKVYCPIRFFHAVHLMYFLFYLLFCNSVRNKSCTVFALLFFLNIAQKVLCLYIPNMLVHCIEGRDYYSTWGFYGWGYFEMAIP